MKTHNSIIPKLWKDDVITDTGELYGVFMFDFTSHNLKFNVINENRSSRS